MSYGQYNKGSSLDPKEIQWRVVPPGMQKDKLSLSKEGSKEIQWDFTPRKRKEISTSSQEVPPAEIQWDFNRKGSNGSKKPRLTLPDSPDVPAQPLYRRGIASTQTSLSDRSEIELDPEQSMSALQQIIWGEEDADHEKKMGDYIQEHFQFSILSGESVLLWIERGQAPYFYSPDFFVGAEKVYWLVYVLQKMIEGGSDLKATGVVAFFEKVLKQNKRQHPVDELSNFTLFLMDKITQEITQTMTQEEKSKLIILLELLQVVINEGMLEVGAIGKIKESLLYSFIHKGEWGGKRVFKALIKIAGSLFYQGYMNMDPTHAASFINNLMKKITCQVGCHAQNKMVLTALVDWLDKCKANFLLNAEVCLELQEKSKGYAHAYNSHNNKSEELKSSIEKFFNKAWEENHLSEGCQKVLHMWKPCTVPHVIDMRAVEH